ncbi:MAG TPA: MSMEG_4193 family putative phosphomutase [Acidimicrobiales bacterium]|nr:MSMEG_4193 family putative phosphomutase [Acidimicrobiales bacterium]
MPRGRRQADPVTTICFVRHGSTPTTGKVLPGRARGLHLSEAGRAEAFDTADRFAGVPVMAVYTSPLERARETAAPITKATGRAARVDRGLVECDFGEWTGEELSKLAKLPEWRAVQRYPSGFRFPGGESFVELQSRVVDTTDRYRSKHPGEVIVAVSHADCIKAALASALGVPLDLFQRIMVGTCSTSVVAYGAAGPMVLTVNSYAPMGRLLSTRVPAQPGTGTGVEADGKVPAAASLASRPAGRTGRRPQRSAQVEGG